jgi:hypothetical protein
LLPGDKRAPPVLADALPRKLDADVTVIVELKTFRAPVCCGRTSEPHESMLVTRLKIANRSAAWGTEFQTGES